MIERKMATPLTGSHRDTRVGGGHPQGCSTGSSRQTAPQASCEKVLGVWGRYDWRGYGDVSEMILSPDNVSPLPHLSSYEGPLSVCMPESRHFEVAAPNKE